MAVRKEKKKLRLTTGCELLHIEEDFFFPRGRDGDTCMGKDPL